MTHLWVGAEQMKNEQRVGITPRGAAKLMATRISVTVEPAVGQSQSHIRSACRDGIRAVWSDIIGLTLEESRRC